MNIFLTLSITVFGYVIAQKITLFFISPKSFYFENKFLRFIGSILFLIIRVMFWFCCYEIITTAIEEFFKYFKVL